MMSTILARSEAANGAAYYDAGRGEPLVLIHGVGMRAEAWQPQIDRFEQQYRIIAVDLPGHGLSAPIEEDANLDDYVDWAEQLIRQLGLGPVNIAGHSMGALIALGLAVKAPSLVRRLAVLNGVYKRDDKASFAVCARAAQISRGKFDFEGPLHRWFSDQASDHAARTLTAAMLSAVNMKAYSVAYTAFAKGDRAYEGKINLIKCPSLFLTGADDLNSTPLMSQEMASETADGTCCIIDGHRHMVGMTAPGTVNSALTSWLGRMEHKS